MARIVAWSQAPQRERSLTLLSVLVGLIVLLAVFGLVGARFRDHLGPAYVQGTSFLGLLIAIFLVLVLAGAIHL